jgi:hypothetical protein
VTGEPRRLNAVGDLVLTDAHAMSTMTDPVRLALFDIVRREGPATTAELAARTGEDGAAAAAHLRALASIGLVEARGDGWAAAARGIYFEVPEDPEGQRAARRLSTVMMLRYAELPAVWARDAEPGIDVEWARAAGLFNARLELTADELRTIQQELERLLEPFTTRDAADRQAGAAPVRILAFFLPEPGE